MNGQFRIIVMIMAISLALLGCIHLACGQSSKLPGGGAYRGNPPVPQAKPPKEQDYQSRYEARYERFYAMYLQNVGKVAERQKEIHIRTYKDQLTKRRGKGLELAKKETEVLKTLRDQAATGKLFRYEIPSEDLMTAINPTVDASAEIIHKLLSEKAVDDLVVTSSLYGRAEHLAKGWVPVLNEIIARQKEPSQALTCAVRALYKAGIDRGKHRPTLERWAIEKQDEVALDILLFDTNKKTGEPIPVRSPANEKLVKTLSVNESLPEHRLLCASYAAATGDAALAEKICLELVSVRLKAFDKTDELRLGEEPLERAREGARYLMFYQLRTEKCFRHIYDLSMILEREEHEHDTMKPDGTWKSYGLSAAGRMEIEQARGLIDEIAVERKMTNDD